MFRSLRLEAVIFVCSKHCVDHTNELLLTLLLVGGIWAKVNNTSGLQIHSLMYRFHPSVKWNQGYPDRKQIVGEIERLWERYGLQDKTKFDTRVEKIYKDEQGRWIINDPSQGRYDGVIAAVGTCGDPKTPHVPGQEKFKGPIYHSSQLDGKTAKDKKVLIIGGGASAIEALEFVEHEKAKKSYVLARSEKYVGTSIPSPTSS